MIYTDNLYEHILSKPLRENGFNRLSIITGYSSPGMVKQHFDKVDDPEFKIDLIIGMGSVSIINHNYYKTLMKKKPDGFQCHYFNEEGSSVHSKLYIWSKGQDFCVFAGSANYSNNAFFNSKRYELMLKLGDDESRQAIKYYQDIVDLSILCTNEKADDVINDEILNEKTSIDNTKFADGTAMELKTYKGLRRVRFSLLTRDGKAHNPGNGLNWGIGTELRPRKDKNASFIPTRQAKNMEFFPPWEKKYFIIQDFHDKDKMFFGVIGGTDGKNLSSGEDNQILGTWFRDKLGLSYGEIITKDHLINYGKTYVDFYKVDNETFLIDF